MRQAGRTLGRYLKVLRPGDTLYLQGGGKRRCLLVINLFNKNFTVEEK